MSDAQLPPLRPSEGLATNRPGQALLRHADSLRDTRKTKPLLQRLLHPPTEERAFRKGAAGERVVAQRLEELGSGWRVLHSIPVGSGDSDLDHLVIGPGGVFTLNSKNHLGKKVWVAGNTFMACGVRQPYIRSARHEAEQATRLLSGAMGRAESVTGVAVVMASQLTVKRKQPTSVFVVGRKKIAEWQRRYGGRLSPEMVALIYDWARDPSLWVKGPP